MFIPMNYIARYNLVLQYTLVNTRYFYLLFYYCFHRLVYVVLFTIVQIFDLS